MSVVATSWSKDDTTAVEQFLHSLLRVVRAGDWAADAAMWAEDGVAHPPNGPAVHGRLAIQKWHESFPPIEEIDYSEFQVVGDGNVAYATYRYNLKLTGMPADTGKTLAVVRRGATGWQLVAASFNSDLPGPGSAGRP